MAFEAETRRLSCNVVWLFFAVSWCVAAGDLTLVFTPQPGAVVGGLTSHAWLNVLNPTLGEASWTFPEAFGCQVKWGTNSLESTVRLLPSSEPRETRIPPGAFARREYALEIPAAATGKLEVDFPTLNAAPLLLAVQQGPAVEPGAPVKTGVAGFLGQAEPSHTAHGFQPGLFFKEHISGYEPFYFIAGIESPNAKFQFSFKYQILNNEGYLAQKAPPLRGLHFAYTQTSLWDWNQVSAPFLDSSYKPELLYLRERVVGGGSNDWFRFDLQPGFQHESNGKSGEDSRSLNIAYLRPTLFFGDPEGLQLTLQPQAWVYVGDLSDNPNIAQYRGYAALRTIVGWERGLQLSAIGRLGDTWDKGSIQLDLTYPMMSLLSRSFSVYLHAQYFYGYGESLLLYNERSSAFRVGFSLYR
jgi:outer membrane phospholipase A